MCGRSLIGIYDLHSTNLQIYWCPVESRDLHVCQTRQRGASLVEPFSFVLLRVGSLPLYTHREACVWVSLRCILHAPHARSRARAVQPRARAEGRSQGTKGGRYTQIIRAAPADKCFQPYKGSPGPTHRHSQSFRNSALVVWSLVWSCGRRGMTGTIHTTRR